MEKNMEKRKKYEQHTHGNYIGNSNTLIYHEQHCRDIHMILPTHIIPTNNTNNTYKPCGHCNPDKTQQKLHKYNITTPKIRTGVQI